MRFWQSVRRRAECNRPRDQAPIEIESPLEIESPNGARVGHQIEPPIEIKSQGGGPGGQAARLSPCVSVLQVHPRRVNSMLAPLIFR
jgi:hypothetical protein